MKKMTTILSLVLMSSTVFAENIASSHTLKSVCDKVLEKSIQVSFTFDEFASPTAWLYLSTAQYEETVKSTIESEKQLSAMLTDCMTSFSSLAKNEKLDAQCINLPSMIAPLSTQSLPPANTQEPQRGKEISEKIQKRSTLFAKIGACFQVYSERF